MSVQASAVAKAARLGRDALRPGGMAPAVRAVRRKLSSSDEAYGLGRNLRQPHTAPSALVPITVRPLVGSDVPAVLEAGASLSGEENWDRRYRRMLLESGIGRPYVAATADDEPCYTQWIFGPEDNDDLQRFFNGIFPLLAPGTALLEGAFTPSAHRGKKIMSEAMSLIAERAGEEVDARHVITFVGVDNIASLKGCARAGFTEEILRRVDVRLGRRRVAFRPLPTPTPSAPQPRRPATGTASEARRPDSISAR